MPKLIFLFIFLNCTFILFSQNSQHNASRELSKAESAYNAQNYEECISHLEEAEKQLNKTRIKIDSLLNLAYSKVEVYEVVEGKAEIESLLDNLPQFPGGEEALYAYISEKISYPNKALMTGVKGKVFTSFVIEKDGRVTNVKVLRGIGMGCDEEALRVIKSMPNWIPGNIDGKPIRVEYMMPLRFSLGN